MAFVPQPFWHGRRQSRTSDLQLRPVGSRYHRQGNQKPLAQLGTNNSDPAWKEKAIELLGNQTAPCSFSHYARRSPTEQFFEGWFVRLILPDQRNIALIFAMEFPQLGTVQVIDPSSTLHICELPRDARFYGNKRRLSVAHWGETTTALKGQQAGELEADDFRKRVLQGWQLTTDGCVGSIVSQHGTVAWDLAFERLLSWGPRRHRRGRHTGSWIGALRIFNPGYQVLVGHGLVSEGSLTVDGERVDCMGATVYIEKNWGRDFPKKWWWTQSNQFGETPDLSVTAVGAVREVLCVSEEVGMIVVHYNGEMFEFAPWTAKRMQWDVRWTRWSAVALSRNGFRAEIRASCRDDPMMILGPTTDGMQFTVKGRMDGWMRVEVLAPDGRTIVRDETEMARVEVGGLAWEDEWIAESDVSKQPLRGLVNFFNGPRAATTP